jgi:carbamoyl-phosphate synthase small subunit
VGITYLVLEDGSVHAGESFGSEMSSHGEVVFNTSMTGYQEVLTDPSYAGQLVTLTYPLVGNYGINTRDVESKTIQVSGLVVRGHCDSPSHGDSSATLHEYLLKHNIPGISGIDTRAVTRRLRINGVMSGIISADDPQLSVKRLSSVPKYDDLDLVQNVTTSEQYTWGTPTKLVRNSSRRVLVNDVGLKYNVLRLLEQRGCEVVVIPADTSAEDMMGLKPSGILFSPGPGDPKHLDYIVENVKKVLGRVPVMGICLGHQLIARSLGAKTYKLKFGHRGANHPVKDMDTGRIYITAQNHGYAVDQDSLPSGLNVSHLNLNDGTVEGLTHRDIPLFTIQYHSEASPGPKDNEYLFDKFLALIDENTEKGGN